MDTAGLAGPMGSESSNPTLIISISPKGMLGLGPAKGIKLAVGYGPAEEEVDLMQLKVAFDNPMNK